MRNPMVRKHWAKLKRLDQQDDAAQFLVMRFIDQFLRGMDPLFSAQWVHWELNKFFRFKYLYTEKMETCFPQPSDPSDIPKSWAESLQDHFAAVDEDETHDPYQNALYEEVSAYMLEHDQALPLLVLRGDLTTTDAWQVQHVEDEVTLGDTEHTITFAQVWLQTWATQGQQLGSGPAAHQTGRERSQRRDDSDDGAEPDSGRA